MNFIQSVKKCLKEYATFSGRASRSEFWWFYLFYILVHIVAAIICSALHSSHDVQQGVSLLLSLLLIIPMLAVGARRLHDIGHSGWWQLLCFTIIGCLWLIYWWIRGTSTETNEHGEPAVRAS